MNKVIERSKFTKITIQSNADSVFIEQSDDLILVDKGQVKQLIEALKEWVGVSEFKKGLGVLLKPTDSEIIEMLRLKILENPSFTTLFIPKGLLSVIPKEIQGLEIIESDLAEAGRIYFANTGRVK